MGAASRVPLHDAPNRKRRNILIINNKIRFLNQDSYSQRTKPVQILDIPITRCISIDRAGVSSSKSIPTALLGCEIDATDIHGTDEMKTKRSLAGDVVPTCRFDTLRRPLRNDEVQELYGHEFKTPLPRPSSNSKSRQIEEEYLKQLIYLLIWKRMEREMLNEYSGLIPQFVRQLDSYTNSFDKVFE